MSRRRPGPEPIPGARDAVEIEGHAGVDRRALRAHAEVPDGRIFVVNYTDDGARWNRDAGDPTLGVSWIRGTYTHPEDLPPR